MPETEKDYFVVQTTDSTLAVRATEDAVSRGIPGSHISGVQPGDTAITPATDYDDAHEYIMYRAKQEPVAEETQPEETVSEQVAEEPVSEPEPPAEPADKVQALVDAIEGLLKLDRIITARVRERLAYELVIHSLLLLETQREALKREILQQV